MKIKLNNVQEEKLMKAIQKEASYREQFLTSRNLLTEAQKSRQDIFDMIMDMHAVDITKYDQQNVKIQDGCIILSELKTEKASNTIKKALKLKANDKNKVQAKR